MSSAGRAASSSGCVARPRGRETGLTGYAEQIQRSLPTGSSAMETAEHREPYESRGSRTDLGAPGGESPPGDSTSRAVASAEAEWPLWARLGDLRQVVLQRARCADSGRSRDRKRTGKIDPGCVKTRTTGGRKLPTSAWTSVAPLSSSRGKARASVIGATGFLVRGLVIVLQIRSSGIPRAFISLT